MANRTFDIEVNLDTGDASKDLKKLNREMDKTEKSSKKAGKGTKGLDKSFGGLSGSLKGAGVAFAGVTAAATVAVAAFVAVDQGLRTLGTQVRELENLSRIAGVSTAEFQGMNLAAKQFGLTGEKVSDIIKDFSDKLGDATLTGAGPFNDAIAALGKTSGLTLQKLSAMSGKEGVSAVIDAMEGANLTTQEQIFLQEALASDLSHATGLFKDNGAAIDDANQSLRDTNSIITAMDLETFSEYRKQADLMDKQFEKLGLTLGSKVAPAMTWLNGLVSDFITMLNSEDSFEQQMMGAGAAEGIKLASTELVKLNSELKEEVRIQKELAAFTRTGLPGAGTGVADANKRVAAKKEEIATAERLLAVAEEQNKMDIKTAKTKAEIAAADPKKTLKQIEAEAKVAAAEAKRLAKVEADLKKRREQQLKSQQEFMLAKEQLLALSKATTAEERIALQIAHEAVGLNLSAEQLAQAQALALQTAAQDKANDAAEDALEIGKQRNEDFADRKLDMERELILLKATTDAERERLQLEFEIKDSGFSQAQAESLKVINEQLIAQEKRNELLAKEKEAVHDLAEAMGSWASGSKDAIKGVIVELIRLVAIRQFGGTGSFLGGFLDGLGGGGMRGFAEGGNFRAGETFMVGEKGPEIITSQAAGQVIPNHQLGGGASVTVTPQLIINGGVNGVDELTSMFGQFSDSIASQTKDLIKRELRPGGTIA